MKLKWITSCILAISFQAWASAYTPLPFVSIAYANPSQSTLKDLLQNAQKLTIQRQEYTLEYNSQIPGDAQVITMYKEALGLNNTITHLSETQDLALHSQAAPFATYEFTFKEGHSIQFVVALLNGKTHVWQVAPELSTGRYYVTGFLNGEDGVFAKKPRYNLKTITESEVTAKVSAEEEQFIKPLYGKRLNDLFKNATEVDIIKEDHKKKIQTHGVINDQKQIRALSLALGSNQIFKRGILPAKYNSHTRHYTLHITPKQPTSYIIELISFANVLHYYVSTQLPDGSKRIAIGRFEGDTLDGPFGKLMLRAYAKAGKERSSKTLKHIEVELEKFNIKWTPQKTIK